MPPIIPSAPWWANLVLLALAVTAPVVITHMSTRRRLDDVKATQERQTRVIAEVHETTVNTHSSILRDDVDRIEGKVDTLVSRLDSQESAAQTRDESLRHYVGDVNQSVRALRHSLDRRDQMQTEALEASIVDRKREVAKAIDTALTLHVADCPARNLKED